MAQGGVFPSNPRTSQTFVCENSIEHPRCVALPPDANAYSVGPDAGIYPETLGQVYSTIYFNSDTFSQSQCHLIKDENDIFYYISSPTVNGLEIWAEVYNGNTGVANYYEIDLPTQFTELSSGGFLNRWFILKRNESELTFVVLGYKDYGDNPNEKQVIQEYLWTIGSSTMTFISSYEWNTHPMYGNASPGHSLYATLLDEQIYVMTYKSAYEGAPSEANVVQYSLGGGGGGFGGLFQAGGNVVSWYPAFFHGGNTIYFFVLYALEPTATKNCIGWLGAPWVMTTEAQVWVTYQAIGAHGGSEAKQVGAYSGRSASAGGCTIWPEYGCNPDTGQVYFKLGWSGGSSNDSDCSECPLTPTWPCPNELSHTYRAYWTLPDNEAYAGWIDTLPTDNPSDPGYWGGAIFTDRFHGYRYSFPSRYDSPLSLILVHDDQYLLNWETLETTAKNKLSRAEGGGANITEGSGQRNDNLPIQIGYEAYIYPRTATIFVDEEGEDYSTIINMGGSARNPITGFIGRFPVYESLGRWIIYGPITFTYPHRVHTQTVEFTPGAYATTGQGTGVPEPGDKGAWNVLDYPTIHSRDIFAGTPTHHAPGGAVTGQAPVWNDETQQYENQHILTNGDEGPHPFNSHTHRESQILDLLHNELEIRGVDVTSTPNDGEYLFYNDDGNVYNSSSLVSLRPNPIGRKTIGFLSSGSLPDLPVDPTRMRSPWSGQLVNVLLEAGDPPGGQDLIIDILLNGTTIFTDPDKRPVILAGEYSGESDTPDVLDVSQDDVFTIEYVQIGTSGSSGGNLRTLVVIDT